MAEEGDCCWPRARVQIAWCLAFHLHHSHTFVLDQMPRMLYRNCCQLETQTDSRDGTRLLVRHRKEIHLTTSSTACADAFHTVDWESSFGLSLSRSSLLVRCTTFTKSGGSNGPSGEPSNIPPPSLLSETPLVVGLGAPAWSGVSCSELGKKKKRPTHNMLPSNMRRKSMTSRVDWISFFSCSVFFWFFIP